jgi:hypothetical protein
MPHVRVGGRSADRSRHAGLVVGALILALAVSWILLTPPGAGPDEPGHLARSGAVARGQLDGTEVGTLSLEAYRLPDGYLVPEPACYAFQPLVSVDCVAPIERTGATVEVVSRADEYPIWGHLVFGLASRLPGMPPIWWARLAGSVAAVGLVTGALVRASRTRPLAPAGILVATTPMAWSTFAQVNPSTFGIAGAIAVWTVLAGDRSQRSRCDQWLLAIGWAALALPRRDGLIWATLILAIMLLASDTSLRSWWGRLGIGPAALIALSTAAAVVWGVTNDSRVSRMVALSPLVVVAADVARLAWRRLPARSAYRFPAVGAASVCVAVVAWVALRSRPGGWDGGLARVVVGQTGTHLVEAIGVLGWLSTPLPYLAVVGWVMLIGVLVAASAGVGLRPIAVAATALATLLVCSWAFELFQGNTSGRYWQGRYSLPVLVGIPIVLTSARIPPAAGRRVLLVTSAGALAIVNVAAWSAARRWGVGVEGSLAPWDWTTVHSPVPIMAVLAIHAACSLALVVVVAALGDGWGARIGTTADDDGAAQPQRLMPSASTT